MAKAALADQFRNQVAPILQKRCLRCHNETEKKGEFSLQNADSLIGSGFVAPMNASESHLLEVISPVNGKARMPKNAEPLAAVEIQIIRDWIDSGAQWPDEFVLTASKVTDFDWWSYKPLSRPTAPRLKDPWVRNLIDSFVLSTLRQKGLTHSPDADRRTLIRRVTYDLIGLPPAPEDIASFIRDERPDAYERLVDRLLESHHYGERWARHWLDVVKYADTCGYDKDKLRPNAWPYRDYVIRSFNDDKPYSRFVQEQIAGDILFPGTPDGILGLGFIAAGPWDFIGHVEVPESKIDGKVARNLDRDDMVSNTLNTFCSVTVQCARCHNHKFDPITQEHYYGLQSIFSAVDRADRVYDLDKPTQQKKSQLQSRLESLRQDLTAMEKRISEAGGRRLNDLETQIKKLRSQTKVKKAPQFGYHSATSPTADERKWVAVDLGRTCKVNRISLHPCHDEFGGIGAGFGFPVRFKIETSPDGKLWTPVADETERDFPNPGLSPYAADFVGDRVRHVRVTATRLADRKGVYIFALAELVVIGSQTADTEFENLADGKQVSALDSIEAPVRWARRNLTDGLWAKAGDSNLASELAAANGERERILARIETPEFRKRRDSTVKLVGKLEQELASLPKGQMVYAASTHFKPQGNFRPTEGKLRPVKVLHRGNIQQPTVNAAPGFVPFRNESKWRLTPELSEGQRRAALARWLTDKDHPLVWRSIVNRVWQYHFGKGIVATPNDFGRMGALPTHPKLLDRLAIDFRDGRQSIKDLHRLIVTSSTYRQSSRQNDSNAAIDGSNQFLWRMNRRRLEAEEIRDAILAVSGALNEKMGGPGFYLFKLEKTAHSPHYEYHKFDPSNPVSHRRSIYRFIVRSQPNPWMTTLDCADSSQSTPSRNETLTSLQALTLLNSRFNLVMAEKFAERLQQETTDLSQQVERAMQLVTQRSATDEERQALSVYAQTHGLPNLCRFLFNLSEFVFLD